MTGAESLDRLRTRLEARAARRPRLEDALASPAGFVRYAGHRLTGFLALRGAGLVIAFLEVGIAAQLIGGTLALALFASHVTQAASAGWWGALEVLRARLRDEPSKSRQQRETSAWIGRGAWVAVGFLVAGALWLALRGRLDALAVFFAVCLLRTAFDLPLRALHAGIYARHRVFRPLAWNGALDIVGLVLTAVTAPSLGTFALVLGMGVSTLAGRALSLHYVLRAYRAHRQPLPRVAWRDALRRPRQPGRALLAAVAGATTRFSSMLLAVCVVSGSGGETGLVSLHLLAPAITTAVAWPQLFYPDLARLRGLEAATFRARLHLVAPLVAVAATAGAVLMIALVDGGLHLPSLLLLLGGQALLSLRQTARLADGKFVGLGLVGLLAAIGLIAAAPTVGDGFWWLAAIVWGALLVDLLLPSARRRGRGQLGILLLAGARAAAVRAVAERLAALGPMEVAVHGRRVVFFSATPIPRAAVLRAGAGLLSGVTLDEVTAAEAVVALQQTTDESYLRRSSTRRSSRLSSPVATSAAR